MGFFGNNNAPKAPAAPQLCVEPPVNPLLVELPSVGSRAEVESQKAVREKRRFRTKWVAEDLAFNYAQSSVANKVGDHIKKYDIWRTWRAPKILQRNLLCLAQDNGVTQEQKDQLKEAFSAMAVLFATGLPPNRALQEGVSGFENADIQFAAYLYCFDLIRRSKNLLKAGSLGEAILSKINTLFDRLSTNFLGLKLRQYFCHYLYVFGESNPALNQLTDPIARTALKPKIQRHRELYNEYSQRFLNTMESLPSPAPWQLNHRCYNPLLLLLMTIGRRLSCLLCSRQPYLLKVMI